MSAGDITDIIEDTGCDKKLKNEWYVWAHDSIDPDWSVGSYKQFFRFDNLADFWKFANNISELHPEIYHYFIMRNQITPTWEDKKNRGGGICSYKADSRQIDLFVDISMLMIDEALVSIFSDEINGVSLSIKSTPTKSSSIVVQIWCEDKLHNPVPNINKWLKEKYPTLKPLWKLIKPEH